MSATTWFTTHPWVAAHRMLLAVAGGLLAALVGAAVAVSAIALTTGSSAPDPSPAPVVHSVPLGPAPAPCIGSFHGPARAC